MPKARGARLRERERERERESKNRAGRNGSGAVKAARGVFPCRRSSVPHPALPPFRNSPEALSNTSGLVSEAGKNCKRFFVNGDRRAGVGEYTRGMPPA